MEIHSYSDASLNGYGCAIYIKIIDENGMTHITLLMSRSKVSPVKNATIFPRLELCAALLLAKTTTRAVTALSLLKVPIFAWTDSTITIAWIKSQSYQMEKFCCKPSSRNSQTHRTRKLVPR
ncbi:uncharacterized protein LOC123318246 [Coccinella septempunctata]|uniref:uncharacterized protein LOC123318246 n=1 Tax=Coccinella septempunctata TaxID=41139 RepID=UPI001D0671F6|nr:uncharacterized protein LOC123318246 [Coccinella septempunctata]